MKNLLITGGMGKIGSYFIQNFDHLYNITVADMRTTNGVFRDHVKIETVDLQDYSNCLRLCQGIDTVIHLAALVDPDSEADTVLNTNIQITQNIFKATVEAQCQRLIYASSAQTIESYPTDIQIHKDMHIRPKNLYGVSKCFGEALAAYYSYNKGLSAICLRIGAYEFPEDHTEMNARDLSAYLHPDDFNQLLVGCIATESIQFEVLNAISNNRYKRLDISEAREKVGYLPQADGFELFQLKGK